MMRNFLLGLIAAAAAAGCTQRQPLVVYSPHGAEMLGDYERMFEAAHPEIDVQCFDMGAKEVHSRIAAEKGNPRCDVWWGGPSTLFMQAADEGLLQAYRPAWADRVSSEQHDAQDRWYATHRSPLAILYNDRGLEAKDAPATWDELLDPKWAGRIALRKPLDSGTMRTFLAAMIARAPGEDAGIEWLKRLHAQTATYPENPGLLFDHIKKNADRVSVWLMPDVVLQRVTNGFPFGYAVPKPTPVLLEGIAIPAGAPSLDAAKQFYEFVTSTENLVQQAIAYAKLPARSDVDRTQLPPKLVEQEIEAMPIDWAEFAAKEKGWCDRWEREVFLASPPTP